MCGERERLWWWLHPLCMTQQHRLASMAARFSSIDISQDNLFPHIPSICLSLDSQQQPSHWDCSTIPKLQLPVTVPSRRPSFLPSVYGCGKDCLILIPFRLPQISCFTFSLKCFSDSDNCPAVGIRRLLQFPLSPRAGPVLLTLLFFPLVPLSYWVLCGSIYSFPLVRSSCPLSAVVLHALLCLKVYSWCIHGERCTPCQPTPLPSCSPMVSIWWVLHSFIDLCNKTLSNPFNKRVSCQYIRQTRMKWK